MVTDGIIASHVPGVGGAFSASSQGPSAVSAKRFEEAHSRAVAQLEGQASSHTGAAGLSGSAAHTGAAGLSGSAAHTGAAGPAGSTAHARATAQSGASFHAEATGQNGLATLLDPLLNLNSSSTSLAERSGKAALADLKPSELMMLTMRSQEFLFNCQLVANVANRSSDGVQQLFRQQS